MNHTFGSELDIGSQTQKSDVSDFEETQEKIASLCDAMKQLLLEKNKRYGNSILSPLRIFSKKDREDSDLPARIDDKLSRIRNSEEYRFNDIADLIGYLFLLLVDLGAEKEDILQFID